MHGVLNSLIVTWNCCSAFFSAPVLITFMPESDSEYMESIAQQTLGIEETTPVTSETGASDQDGETVDEGVLDDHTPTQI